MIAIMVRNLKLFFRDKTAVFFSLLGVLIIIGLYVLFLGDMIVRSMPDIPGARFLMDSWIMGGVLAVTSMTTTMGAFGIMVDDRHRKILLDFQASPLKRSSLAAGYVLSAYIIGLIMTVVAFVFGELYILSGGGSLVPVSQWPALLACLLLSVLASSAMVFFVTTLFSSQNAFSTASTVIGTLIGFLMGIYIPIGNLPASVQRVIQLFPISHAGVLLRQIMMAVPSQIAFAQAPTEVLQSFQLEMGVTYVLGGQVMPVWSHVVVLLVTAIVFYVLAVLNLSRKKN